MFDKASDDCVGSPIYFVDPAERPVAKRLSDQEVQERLDNLSRIADSGGSVVSAACRNDGSNGVIFSIAAVVGGEFSLREMAIPPSAPIQLVEALLIAIISDTVKELNAQTDWSLNKTLCGFGQ